MKFPEFENIFCIPCVSQYLHSTTRAEEAGLGLVSGLGIISPQTSLGTESRENSEHGGPEADNAG